VPRKISAAKDPADTANRAVLAKRQELIDEHLREIPDLGLDIEQPAASAAEVLRDAWDRKVFGDEPKTISRVVYGPDPLLDSCPAFKEAIEKNGKADYAEATAAAIMRFGHKAVPDPVMQKGLFKAIQRFGPEAVASAFRERILKIPERQVEYEQDGEFGDPLLLGSNALRDCVVRYGQPGQAYKFLSQRCMDVLGMRGYTLVKASNGDPVKAGTLFMASIPQHVADARRIQFARESEEEVRAQEAQYMDAADRFVRGAGRVGAGSRPLSAGETVRAAASEREDMVGGEYAMGVQFDRQA
jgi:hypothetical protein